MELKKRPAIYALPSYSLTGDLLGFLRCGLQYRYTRLGKLPAARPVQMWFGEFIHGVLEESYRQYDTAARAGKNDAPPWGATRVDAVRNQVKQRLAAERLFPWDEDVEALGDARAEAAINELGPQLFPVIHRAEVRLTGARPLPVGQVPQLYRFREADRYEMVGIVDVITHIELGEPSLWTNMLVRAILDGLPGRPPERFEVIIDYKGMRRPPVTGELLVGHNLWDIYGWQVQTYAHLRSTHEDSLPVVAGIVIYLNELLPSRSDMRALRQEVRLRTTDVMPEQGGAAARLIGSWRGGDEVPDLPLEFRLKRALRVVPVTEESIRASLRQFDGVVARIETCRGRELAEGRVISAWDKNPSDESTCTACSSKTYCPAYQKESEPQLPGVRVKG